MKRWVALSLLLPGLVQAKLVRSSHDLKFFELQSPDRPARYLGFTSSKLDNVVEVPGRGLWYIRLDGKMTEERFKELLGEVHDKRYPGLDVSDRWDISNHMLEPLRGNTSLRLLKLNRTKISDGGLTILRDLPRLEVLGLSNQITNEGLKPLQSLRYLKALELQRSRVTDAGLPILETLPKLQVLDLSESVITDSGAKVLSRLHSLRYLDVSGTLVGDRGLAAIAELPHLSVLYGSARISDKGVREIARIKTLTSLDLSGSRITTSGLKPLIGLKHLEALAISDTDVTDEAVKTIALIRSLKTLEISGTRIGAAGLAMLAGMPRLEVISVSWTHLSGQEIAALRNIPKLDRIILSGRTVDREVLARFKAFTLKPSVVASRVSPAPHMERGKLPLDRMPRRGSAVPVVHPPKVSFREPAPARAIPAGETLPRDIPSLAPDSAAPIRIETEPQGKGMMIEVAAAPSRAGSKSAPRLTGLKRLHQIDMSDTPADLALESGASPVIKNLEDDPKNSLGEINVQAR